MSSFIIRDVIHGDIEFDDNIKQILNCPEFQRLHRIHQLSCEYLVFPTATHTRFSHSIGTYHVMKKLIEHFTVKLEEKGYKVKKEDKQLAYVAALLHDIGHGAFSHTFEKIFSLKSHEAWTMAIIKDKNTHIHKKIIKLYGKAFLQKLIDVMSKSYKNQESSNIFSIIATLVSSQTDADRMDYLLRDSYFTSVTNGRYDIERLIKSFGVTQINSELRIYINEKYMSTLEEYVLARYFMHKEVYQHTTKRHMEICLCLIFKRVKEILVSKTKIFCDDALKNLILKKNITVSDYLKTDDSYFMYHIMSWTKSKDDILVFLCNCFLNREQFDIEVSYDEEMLKSKINKLLAKHNKQEIKDLNDEYFYIETQKQVNLYVSSTENIWIKSKDDDKLYDLSQKSLIINRENAIKDYSSKNIFISSTLFKIIYGIDLQL